MTDTTGLPARTSSITSRWPGRRPSKPNTSRRARAIDGDDDAAGSLAVGAGQSTAAWYRAGVTCLPRGRKSHHAGIALARRTSGPPVRVPHRGGLLLRAQLLHLVLQAEGGALGERAAGGD